MEQTVPEDYKIAALEKGLRVLACFTPSKRALGVSEVARETRIPTSTCFRILRTLESSGYVKQLADGSFSPSAAVLKLGFAALQGNEIVEATRPPLRDLHRQTRETCSLAVLSETDIIYLLRYKSDAYVIANVVAGSILPAAYTAMGKMLLACHEDAHLDALLPRIDLGARHVGPNAATDLTALRTELLLTRRRGWAEQNEEVAHGLRSIAVPVMSLDGAAGAIGVSVEAGQWSEQRMIDELLPPLRVAADRASVSMGYLPSAHLPA